MYSHFVSFYHLTFFTIITFILCTSLLVASENDVINKLCDLTDFPQFCRRALNSHPQSHKADLDDLTLISIHLVSVNATSIKNKIKEMKKSLADHNQLQSR